MNIMSSARFVGFVSLVWVGVLGLQGCGSSQAEPAGVNGPLAVEEEEESVDLEVKDDDRERKSHDEDFDQGKDTSMKVVGEDAKREGKQRRKDEAEKEKEKERAEQPK